MASDKYIFISYSRQDAQIVEQLTFALQERGVKAWRDLEQIEPGANWTQAIEKGLRGASALIYVGSRHAARSHWMNEEVSAFIQENKLIIPVIFDDTGADSLPEFLHNYQWIDLREGIELAVNRIIDSLRGKVTIGASVERKAKQSKGYVFLNYAEEDSDFIEELKAFMKERGYAYWDYEESDRDYHSQLFLELEGVITESVATLSVLSEAWKRSKWTVKEYFFSEEIGIPVFLLRAKEIGPTLAIAGVPYIDFVSDTKAGFSKLDKELRRKNF